MNSLTLGIIAFGFLLASTSYIAYFFDGGKVYMAIGLGMQILGFTSLLASQTTLSIKDHELFNKLFHKHDKVMPEVQGGIYIGKFAAGLWLIMLGLSVQLIGLFLIE